MKKPLKINDWNIMIAEKRKIVDDDYVAVVIRHQADMLATKRNKGVRATYTAYQALLPKALRTTVPVLMVNATFNRDYQTLRAAKEILDKRKGIKEIMTDEIKTAHEQYLIMMRLAR